MIKLQRAEKTIIALSDPEKYITYDCPKGGITQVRSDLEQICPYCKEMHEPVANINELRNQYRKELKFEV